MPGQAGAALERLDPQHFDDDALLALTVEFSVEDLFPWTEVELSSGNRYDDFPAHNSPLQVRVAIILAG